MNTNKLTCFGCGRRVHSLELDDELVVMTWEGDEDSRVRVAVFCSSSCQSGWSSKIHSVDAMDRLFETKAT